MINQSIAQQSDEIYYQNLQFNRYFYFYYNQPNYNESKMFTKDGQFEQPEPSNLLNLAKPQINVSVLRHLSKPLEILEKDESYLNFSDPVCCYTAQLHTLPDKILPTQQNTQKQQLQATRLISMQNAQTEFQQVKRMFECSRFRTENNNSIINEDQQSEKIHHPKTKTLYNMFCLKPPYYCRFQNHNVSKNNFANVFVNVGGVNLEAKPTNGGKSLGGTRKVPRFSDRQKLYNTGNLIFDSSFESGNLLYAYEKHPQTDNSLPSYQLILQNDTNTYGHNQWFFFRVQSLKPHLTVKFSILNLIKSDSLFNYGLKPLVFSQKDNFTKNIGWLRRGENVKYYQNDIRRQNKKENYFTLEFEYTFKQSKDWVYFSPCYPYTYTQMTNYIENLYSSPQYKKCFSIKTICETMGNNKVNLITISTGKKSIEECKVVWVLARQHPAETTGSFMVEGMLRYLLPLISEAKSSPSNTVLSQLNDYVFKIVPMINVDGVIHGNSRAELIGLDPNRLWKKPRKAVTPVIHHLLKEILTYKSNISLVLDLHSHSKKTGCFFYGNEMLSNSKLPKIYPTLVCENDERFILKNCRFHGGYRTTARHVLFRELNQCENIFTVQCSLLGYLNSKTNRVTEYTIQDFHQMGAKLIENFFKLENIKLQKGVNQVIEQFNQKIDNVCEVDSAKSQSGISDDQYEEIKDLEKRFLGKKKKNLCDKKNVNKSLVPHLAKQQTKQQHQNKHRACSYNKHRTRTILSKIQQNTSVTAPSTQKSVQSKLQRKSTYARDDSCTTIRLHSQKQVLQNVSSNLQSPNVSLNTITSLKQTYMKYLSNPKIYHESKGKTDDITKIENKVTKVDSAVQVTLERRNNMCENRVLQTSNGPLNIINDSIMRPLLILGNTCQAQYTIFNKNEISVQVNFEDDKIKKEQKAIAKLPKLMNLITSSKQRIKKYSHYASKQNQSLLATSTAAKYFDQKSVVHEQRQKKGILFNNIKSRHA